MAIELERIIFKDLPSTETPINSENLNKIQNNIENAISTINTYSTEETIVGTWIDGKPIYRKVIYGQTNSEEYIEIDLGDTVSAVTRVDGFLEDIDQLATTIPHYWNENLKAIAQIRLPNLYLTYGANFKNCNYVLVIEYTKTTD